MHVISKRTDTSIDGSTGVETAGWDSRPYNMNSRGSISAFKHAAIANTLRGSQLFAGLPAADLEAIAEITIVKSLEKGEYLFREGDPSSGFYVVQKGAVNVHRVNAAGKEQVIHVFRPGETFAEASLATDLGYPADSRALESSQVLLVRKSEFLQLLRRRPELGLRMLGSMALHLRVLVGQIEDLTLKDVETRLANWLIKRCPNSASPTPHTINLTITKRALAAELSTVGETFSRTLAKFRERGLVTVRGNVITIVNPAKLTELLRRNLGEPV
jgi:CRP/FNR family transcriptional regulator, dissimilatory nitrate respiration regulator